MTSQAPDRVRKGWEGLANDPFDELPEPPEAKDDNTDWARRLKTAMGHARLDRLTAREIEVLELVAQGKSNKEIARTLCITTNTSKAHVHSILHKLGFESRTEAAVLWTRLTNGN